VIGKQKKKKRSTYHYLAQVKGVKIKEMGKNSFRLILV
jgi:hypothetical protein